MTLADYPGHFLALLVLLALGAILVLAYRTEAARSVRAWRWVLAGMHGAAVLMLVVILWNPSKPLLNKNKIHNTVLAVFDSSESMSVADVGKNRLDSAVETFTAQLPTGDKAPQYRLYGFDTDPYEVDGASTLHRWGARSDLRDVLQLLAGVEANQADAKDKEESQIVGAVVFTDGQADVKSADAYPKLSGKDLDVWLVGVGKPDAQPDLAIDSIDAPTDAQIDTAYTATVHVRSRNANVAGAVNVEVLQDGLPVTARTLAAKELQQDQATVEIELPAAVLGEHRLTARVSGIESEANTANNELETVVNVVEEPVAKVFLYSEVAYPAVGKIREALSRDKRVHLDFGWDVLIEVGRDLGDELMPGRVPFPETSDALNAYDVVILGPCTEPLSRDRIEMLYNFVVKRGGGLVLLPGRDEADITRTRDAQMQTLLPVMPALEQPRQPSRPGQLELMPSASMFGVLSPGEVKSFRKKAQPFDQSLRPKPAANVLAAVGELPALCMHRVGRGRVCYLNIDRLHTWYREDLEGGLLASLFDGLTTYLSRATERESHIETFAQRREENPYTVEFEAQVFDETFRPVSDATVLLYANGQVLRMSPSAEGRYKSSLPNVRQGVVVARLQAEHNGVFLGERTTSAKVALPQTEMDQTELDESFLKKLASYSGLNYVRAEALDAKVGQSFDAIRETTTAQESRPLWPRWSVFLTLCALLSATWFIRRKMGMV